MLISFLNDVDIHIQLIIELKNSFGKYPPVFPKITLRAFFGTPCIISIIEEAVLWFNHIGSLNKS